MFKCLKIAAMGMAFVGWAVHYLWESDKRVISEGRARHIRELCEATCEFDTIGCDRWWLADSVLNILDGLVDPEIRLENDCGTNNLEFARE